jgi:hypothetical protein
VVVAVPVVGNGHGLTATVDNSKAPGGYVSLRVDMTDQNGATVEQTTTRAYGVR